MKILMLVNWKVKRCKEIQEDIQAPDYFAKNEKYWFFRYFPEDTKVDVIDISSFRILENFERNKLHFYIIQSIKAILKIRKYDIVLSHGMPSGIALALFRRFFKTKAKHIVFDIGSFNSAAESGKILKLNQFASKSIDGIIYHSSKQLDYYKKFYPWIVEKTYFLPFGTDLDYFAKDFDEKLQEKNYILSIGYSMRDIDTLINAYKMLKTNVKLRIIGNPNIKNDDERIEILGPIDKRELSKQIQCAQFCILPLVNKNYSFGQMTLLQQMYFQKTVITANVPSMMDYVKDGENAILYQSENIDDLKNKIELVLENESLRHYLGYNARKVVINKYNEKIMAKNINSVIKKVVYAE